MLVPRKPFRRYEPNDDYAASDIITTAALQIEN